MALLPAVNEKATREAVREFFDSEWPRIVNMADMGYVDLKSVEISDMPSARSFGNANDERFTNHTDAVYYYDAVVHAIKVMTQPHRHFMWLRYVRHLEWLQVEALTGYGTRRGQEIIDEAFLLFADNFSDVDDLRVKESSSY